MNKVICTSVACDTKRRDARVLYPQISHLNAAERHAVYWKCAIVCMASARRTNPDARLILLSNADSPPLVDGIELSTVLQSLGVEFRQRLFSKYLPPLSASKTFRNAFFKYEALDELSDLGSDAVMLVDCDCVFAHSAADVFACISGNQIGVYTVLDSAAKAPFQGIEPAGMRELYGRCFGHDKAVSWQGGEFYCATPESLRKFVGQVHSLMQQVLADASLSTFSFPNGQLFFSNDEFLGSIALARCPAEVQSLNRMIGRLWTGEGANRSLADRQLTVWHLPAEKHLGFDWLFREVVDERSGFWSASPRDFVKYLGGALAIPRRMHNVVCQPRKSSIVEACKYLSRSVLPAPLWRRLRSLYYRGHWE